jgi:hypothetical protein
MQEYEARCLVEQWVRDSSPFGGTATNANPSGSSIGSLL